MNYISGTTFRSKGQEFLYNDLEIKIDIDKAKLTIKKRQHLGYKIINSYADGINYYLYNTLSTTGFINPF
jgi:acyl-homoserine lactone acylase PvdQ